MLRPNWHKRLFAVDSSRAARRRRRKNRSLLEKLELRALLASSNPFDGGALLATEGVAVTGFQETFSVPDTQAPAADFSASIDWGDGLTTAGTVSGANGFFTVTGGHTYADELNSSYAVTLFEPAANFTSTPVTGSVTVGEGDSGSLSAATIIATEGQAFSGAVGSFTDNYIAQVAGDFTATIDWGDGSTATAGTITGGNGNFTISGDHTYADEGAFSVVVAFFDDAPSTLTATIYSTANVADADYLTGTGNTITPIETQPFSGVVATFSDTNAAADPDDFSADIDWGDGTIDLDVPVTGGQGTDLTVSGAHTYAEDGAYTLTTVIMDDPPETIVSDIVKPAIAAPSLGTATAVGAALVSEASLQITGATIAATEGQAFNGVVATASDPGSTDPASEYSATIDWGDGTIGAGTITGSDGSYTITGAHTYADEGAFTATVTFFENNSPTFPISLNDPVSVAEADTLAPGFITTGNVAENDFLGGKAAAFLDAGYPTHDPADFTGTFDWGDGTTFTTGGGNVTISSDGAGLFTLFLAAHAYADEGVYTVVATLADDAPGTASLSQTGTLTVTEADAFTPVPSQLTLAGTEGTSLSGKVAVFADTGYPNNDPADFTATIDWGDGTSGSGTVTTAGDGAFTVSGARSYSDDGVYTITATIADDAPGTATATTTAIANIAEADLTLAPAVGTFSATEGMQAAGIVATILDPGSADPASDYSATIDWGDGTISNGTVSGASGVYLVSGGHAYADEGAFTVTVTATETSAAPHASATATVVANIAEGDVLVGSAAAISATEGTAFTGNALATFTDMGYPGNVAADFTATIDWGDGGADVGPVTGTGIFTVSGNHTYTDEGSYPVTIVITDDAPGTASATATTTATVAEGDVLVGSAAAIRAIEGTAFTGAAVATFTDTGFPGNVAADFTATIDWGDGGADVGTVTGTGTFTVSGNHTYTDEGSYPVTIVITDDAPGTASATATTTATVAEGDTLVAGAPITLAATEGAAAAGILATFTDTTYAGNLPGDFTAAIDWGDGATDVGVVTGSAGSFTVSGSHVYAEEGAQTATIVLSDDAPGTAAGTATAAINVADAPLSATGATIAAPEFTTFSGVVATFTDADPNGTVADYTATIDWGDGATTAGTISVANGGGFQVTGTHAYAEDGAYTVTATIADVGGSSATASGAANISEPPIAGQAVAINGFERSPLTSIPVATFTHGNGREPASEFTALIHWGDDTSSVGVVSQLGATYTVSGAHDYLDEGLYTVEVQLSDDDASTRIFTAAKLREELLPNGVLGTPNERFITEIYRDLFHRQVDPTALPYWSKLLDQGQSRAQVVAAIIATAMPGELGADLVTGIFEKYLGRDPDPAGLAFWVGIISQKESIEDTEANIVGTPEFFALSGGTNDGFIDRLFHLALGRDAEPSAAAVFNGYLSSGMTREQAAELVFDSHEFHQDEIAGYYQSPVDLNDLSAAFLPFIDDLDFFDRPADAPGLAAFTAELDNGGFDQQVWVQMIASDEFFAKIA